MIQFGQVAGLTHGHSVDPDQCMVTVVSQCTWSCKLRQTGELIILFIHLLDFDVDIVSHLDEPVDTPLANIVLFKQFSQLFWSLLT